MNGEVFGQCFYALTRIRVVNQNVVWTTSNRTDEERRPTHGLLSTRLDPRGAEEPAALRWGHNGLRAVAADQGSHGDASLEAHE